LGGGTLVQPPRSNSERFGHKSSPLTVEPEPPGPPGSAGISLKSAQRRSSTGSRYATTVSTGTATKVTGEKHLAATVIVCASSKSPLKLTVPLVLANSTSGSLAPRITVAPPIGRPVMLSSTVTLSSSSRGCPLNPPRKLVSASP